MGAITNPDSPTILEGAIAGNAGEAGKVLKADDPFVTAHLELKSFGAKWDGTTDDTGALEAAISAAVGTGREVRLPAGVGVINGTPAIPKNLSKPVVIRGAGERDTTVLLKTALQFLKFANTAKGDTVGNVQLFDFTVDGNNKQVEVAGTVPVVIGTATGCQEQVDIKNVTVERVRTINVPTLEAQENGRRNIVLQVFHNEPGLAKNVIDNIRIRDCEFNGGQYGVFVAGIKGGSPLPLNVYIGSVRIGNIKYVGPKVPDAMGYCAGVQIGQYAWSDGRDIVVENIYSENSCDVANEFDVPCTVRKITGVNGNNSNLLLNTFNPTTTGEPIVAKLTAKAEIGATELKVSSTANFAVGEQIVLYAATIATCEVRTIKAIGAGSIELTEGISTAFAVGAWLSQVDVGGGKMYVEDFTSIRTARTPGSERGFALQNIENPIPAPAMEINGYVARRSYKGVPANAGEVIKAQYGTNNSKTGNPRYFKARRMQIDISGVELGAAETVNFSPIHMKLLGAVCPIELQGEMTITGAGVTGTGHLPSNLVKIFGSAEVDIDLQQKATPGSTGGEAMRFLCLNEEAVAGSISGRVRQRVRSSSIGAGGGSLVGVRLGKGCGFASSSIRTKTLAIVAAGATSFEVENAAEFTAGMAIVLDAESTTKSEVFSIEKVEGSKIFLVPVLNVGTAAEHAAGVVVARLNHLIVEDSSWVGLGINGTAIALEDTKVGCRLLLRGSMQPKPTGSSAVAIPESGKVQQILQAGQSGVLQIKGGTITKVEYSSNGSSFFQVASSGNVGIPVNPGDFFKLTYTVAPEAVNFIPGRV